MHLIPTGRVYDGISSKISFVRFVILFFTRGNIFSIGMMQYRDPCPLDSALILPFLSMELAYSHLRPASSPKHDSLPTMTSLSPRRWHDGLPH